MKRFFSLILFFAIASTFCSAQNQFHKSYFNPDGQILNSAIQTSDSGYAFTGWYNVDGPNSSEYYITKTDRFGEVEWSKTYGEKVDKKAQKHAGGNECFYIHESMDGGYFLIGEVHGFGEGNSEIYAVKTNAKGDTLWTRTYGSRGNEYCSSAIENADSGYTIVGFTESFNVSRRNGYVLRLDKQGDTLWTKTIGSSLTDALVDIKRTQDGNYILIGSTESYTNGKSDVWLLKMDLNGNVLWERIFGGEQNDFGYSLCVTRQNGFMIAASTDSYGAGQEDVYLIRTDSVGALVWSYTLGGAKFESASSIVRNSKNEYIITGNTNSNGVGKEDIFVAKFDENLDSIKTKLIGSEGGDFATNVITTNEGGYLVSGYSTSYEGGQFVSYLLKLDSNLSSGCIESTLNFELDEARSANANVKSIVRFGAEVGSPKSLHGNAIAKSSNICKTIGLNKTVLNKEVRIYPNPANQSIAVSASESLFPLQISVYDVNGQLLQKHLLTNTSQRVDISSLNSGYKYLQLRSERERFSKSIKLLVQ